MELEQVASSRSGRVLEPGESPPLPAPPVALPLPVVTLALIAINVIVWGLTLALGASAWQPSPQKMIELGGNFARLTLADEPWRLASAMFLHYGVLHLGMNMLGLWSGGAMVERMYGRVSFASLYLLAGLAGGVATVAIKADAVSAGASGAIFGVFGAIGAFLLVHRDRIEPEALRRQSRGLVAFMGYNLLFGFTQPSIDMSAHIGGLAAGFVVGLALLYRLQPGRGLARAALVTVLGLGVVAGGVSALPVPAANRYQQAYSEFDAVQATAMAAYNTLVTEAQAGKLDDPTLADRLERDVLAPWKQLEDKLTAMPPPGNARLRGMHAAILDYVAARREAWAALDDLLRGRSTDGARFKQLHARAEERLALLMAIVAR